MKQKKPLTIDLVSTTIFKGDVLALIDGEWREIHGVEINVTPLEPYNLSLIHI